MRVNPRNAGSAFISHITKHLLDVNASKGDCVFRSKFGFYIQQTICLIKNGSEVFYFSRVVRCGQDKVCITDSFKICKNIHKQIMSLQSYMNQY